jgi:hydrogenase maturation protease
VSESQHSLFLVIGYGNPLRGDDGVGWNVVEELTARERIPHADLITSLQLVPELAERISRTSTVCFVDAAGEGIPGAWQCESLTASAQAASPLGHHATPQELLSLTRSLYASAPEAFLFTICGGAFECGEGLSLAVATAVPLVASAIEHLFLEKQSALSRVSGFAHA